jgi:segregation and condensation protein B
MDNKQLKSIIESLLFINERPIELSELVSVFEVEKKDITAVLEELTKEYQERNSGISIVQVAGGYQMCSSPESEPWVKKMYQERNKQKLSTAALETLAIIAYKQPITRIEIESIRGVSADSVVKKLTDLGLIKIGGRKDVVGKPFLYITTRTFLEYFGINTLKDLPKLEEFASLTANQASPEDSSLADQPEGPPPNSQDSEPPNKNKSDSCLIPGEINQEDKKDLPEAVTSDHNENSSIFIKKETEQ